MLGAHAVLAFLTRATTTTIRPPFAHLITQYTAAADFDWMGYSVRSSRWRYTLWVAWNRTALAPIWDSVEGEELYDHLGNDGTGRASMDGFERVNLASADANPSRTPAQQAAIASLRAVVEARFG